MSAIVQRWEYVVKPLSPVHVGSGETLGRHEFTVENGQIIRYNSAALLELLATKGQGLLDRYVEGGLQAVMGSLSQGELDHYVLYRAPVSGSPREIREHIADGLGRVYLPGSSLKGAIRTALAWSYLQEGHADELRERALQGQKREQAGQPLLRAILGEIPNLDLLRALRVFDSTPFPRSQLRVAETKVAALENGRLLWFTGPRRPKQPDIRRGASTFIECLPLEMNLDLRLVVELDEFLVSGTTHSGEPHPVRPPHALTFEERRKLVGNWQERCNNFALHVAEREVEFAEEAGLPHYKEFHEQRLQELQSIQKHEESVFLVIGWGGGWRTKTVTEAFDTETVCEIRKQFGLEAHRVHRTCGARVRRDNRAQGAYFCPRCRRGGLREVELTEQVALRYPKTRKIVVENRQPLYPLGWVRLEAL